MQRRSLDWLLILAIAGTVALLVAASLATVGFAIGYRPPQVVDKHLDAIRQRGTLRVGTDASYPPFAYVENGEYKGYDVEMAKKLAERMGLKAEFVNISYDGLYDAVRSARVDIVVSALSPIPELQKDFSYSTPYFNAGQVLVIRSDEANIKSAADLVGRAVGVELGSLADTEARRLQTGLKGMSLRSVYHTPADALLALTSNQVDAVMTDPVSAIAFARTNPEAKILAARLTDEPYVIAMPADAPRLLAGINGAIDALSSEGTLARLAREWF